MNIVIDGRAYSMPMADPTVNITFDGAVQACRCKGLGYSVGKKSLTGNQSIYRKDIRK